MSPHGPEVSERVRRPRPVTAAQHADEARRLIEMATRTPFRNEDELIREARRHVEAARLLTALEEMHK